MDHLLRATDISAITQPPNLVEHPEWQHVFVQSCDGDTLLTPGTKYLFCKYSAMQKNYYNYFA